MKAIGRNRYLVIEIVEDVEEDQSESLVLLPDEFQEPQGRYAIGRVKVSAIYNNHEWNEGDIIAFPRSVLQEVTFHGETTYLIQENYIVCLLMGED